MTQRDKTKLEMWWYALRAANNETGRWVTAGELASRIGYSRNTAKLWLSKLIKSNAAESAKKLHFNKNKMTVYRITEGANL